MRRALGDGHPPLSMSLFPGSSTSAEVPGSSLNNIFPTRSAEAKPSTARSPPNLYLIFLGVLLFLIVLSGTLAVRAIRIRHRYRSAVQAAIANGEPIPVWDPHGFGTSLPPQLWGMESAGAFIVGRGETLHRDFGPRPILYDVLLCTEETSPSSNNSSHLSSHLQPLSVLHRIESRQPRAHPHRGGTGSLSKAVDGANVLIRTDEVEAAFIIQMPIENQPETVAAEGESPSGWRPGTELAVLTGFYS